MDKVDVSAFLKDAGSKSPEARGISNMARSLVGSEILRIAAEVKAFAAQGNKILDLTVGDFSSKEFPIPDALSDGIVKALKSGHSNYPPSSGVIECREAVREMFEKRLGLSYPVSSVLIAGGARPMIAGIYLALCSPKDKVVYSIPSWNNNHYCTVVGAERIEVSTSAATQFFPRAEDLAPHLADARLVCLNSPQNPTGTVIDRASLEKIARAILDENKRRQASGKAPVYLMYDQVYWMLTFGDAVHYNPVSLVPEMAAYTIFVDGISKAFASTGLRVGWAVGPTDVIERMSAILTHLGAWAPRPEQVATAELLRNTAAVDAYLASMNRNMLARLGKLSGAIEALKSKGHKVDCISPQGAIYLSLKIDLVGKTTAAGRAIKSDEETRKYLLEEAGIALVPFQCFGTTADSGWFRASVGAVSLVDCDGFEKRLGSALDKLH
jgi:aspartate aminotransferase